MQALIFAVVGVALYAGLYYSAGPKATVASPPRQRDYSLGTILLHFFLGLTALFVIDGAVFHSGFYTAFLKRDSFAGNIALLVAQERARPRSETTREIALLGDSQMFEAFSAKAADARATKANLRFINLAAFQCELRVWYYILRELDPHADRYHAIVIPIRYADVDRGNALINNADDISLAAPFLRYTDAFDFARSFTKWPAQCRAFVSCILRGYAFRDDLHDLLNNSSARFQLQRADSDFLKARYEYAGSEKNLVGVSVDPATKEVFVPEQLAELRPSLLASIKPGKERGLFKKYRSKWLRRILDRYERSDTTIVFVQMPRGPLGAPNDSLTRENSIGTFARGDGSVALDSHLFDRLERPEFFFDRSHLNASGRAIFTEILTDELLGRFQFSSKVETADAVTPP